MASDVLSPHNFGGRRSLSLDELKAKMSCLQVGKQKKDNFIKREKMLSYEILLSSSTFKNIKKQRVFNNPMTRSHQLTVVISPCGFV